MHHSLCTYLDKLKHAPHELEQGVEKADHTIWDGAKEIEQKLKNVLSVHPGHNDDEEGWMSDASEEEHPTASTSSTTNRRNRSKSPKLKAPTKAVGAPPRKARRRNSARRAVLARSTMLKHKKQENSSVFDGSDEEGDDDDRGRSRSTATDTTDELAPRAPARNPRLDAIKVISARREVSPARSIRFADEVGDGESRSGTTTPRTSILQDPGSPHPSLGDTDSPKNQSTFSSGDV